MASVYATAVFNARTFDLLLLLTIVYAYVVHNRLFLFMLTVKSLLLLPNLLDPQPGVGVRVDMHNICVGRSRLPPKLVGRFPSQCYVSAPGSGLEPINQELLHLGHGVDSTDKHQVHHDKALVDVAVPIVPHAVDGVCS